MLYKQATICLLSSLWRSIFGKVFMMTKKQDTYYCSTCKKQVNFHYEPVNHMKMALLSLLTLGLWVPVWMGLTFVKVKYCDECDYPLSDD